MCRLLAPLPALPRHGAAPSCHFHIPHVDSNAEAIFEALHVLSVFSALWPFSRNFLAQLPTLFLSTSAPPLSLSLCVFFHSRFIVLFVCAAAFALIAAAVVAGAGAGAAVAAVAATFQCIFIYYAN